ncbi:chromosome condensation protein CrcB (plasmid) [Halostagnicola larsenii XH-48]|uniref:Fluoride-specific ion channel FluC n=1 Tax=Halostagnicola larsenii XH-48 TaxID=797299 RepID=W0JY04_9EURY|nr:fluoride efflux transporter CrcB [Halostagnicola larsenii]AHG02167.1 chromosome condensation protein CrcB [Halostagnicola larsenii XH-48]
MEAAHLLGTGGAIGAVLRYLVDQKLAHDRFPISTLVVNVVGSFALGLVVFVGFSHEAVLFVGTGACGSFTTYSSFSVQTVQLWETGDRVQAVIYAGGTLSSCLLAAGGAVGIAMVLPF